MHSATKGAARRKETWWWNGEVAEAVKVKRRAFEDWHHNPTPEKRTLYLQAKKKSRYAVWKAKESKRKDLTKVLESVEGRKNVFKIVKQMKRECQDPSSVECIKNEAGDLVATNQDVKNVWKDYMSKLLNRRMIGMGTLVRPKSRVLAAGSQRLKSMKLWEE